MLRAWCPCITVKEQPVSDTTLYIELLTALTRMV